MKEKLYEDKRNEKKNIRRNAQRTHEDGMKDYSLLVPFGGKAGDGMTVLTWKTRWKG